MSHGRKSTQSTTVLPVAEKHFALAKKHKSFREGYLIQALHLGTKRKLDVVSKIFDESDSHIVFLRQCGVIGENK